MKKMLLVTLMVLLGSTGAWASLITDSSLLAGYPVIDFESQSLSSYQSTSAGLTIVVPTFGSVTFQAMDNQFQITDSNYPGYGDFSGGYNTTGQSLTNGFYNSADTGTYMGNGPGFMSLKISFSDPVAAFGFNMGAIDNNWTLAAYTSLDVPIPGESYAVPAPIHDYNNFTKGNTGEFYGILSEADPISYVLLTNTGNYFTSPYPFPGVPTGYDWIFIDNLRVMTSDTPVPIPSAALLLGSGLVALVGLRKKFLGRG